MMTNETFETASTLKKLTQAAKYLILENDIDANNFNYLFHNDEDFHKEFLKLRDKYWDLYINLFKEL